MALKRSRPAPSDPQDVETSATSLSALREQLGHADAEQRRFATLALVNHQGAAAILVEHLKVEPSAIVREAVFTTLARLGDPDSLAGIAHCLHSEDASLRNGAIEILKLLPEQTATIIPKLLADSNSDVRILTISILESLRHPSVEQWLLEVLDSDTHLNVCGAALDLLVEVGSPKALASIEQVKKRFQSEPYIQFAADLAVKRIKKG
jgi:HEAT repeat protein